MSAIPFKEAVFKYSPKFYSNHLISYSNRAVRLHSGTNGVQRLIFKPQPLSTKERKI